MLTAVCVRVSVSLGVVCVHLWSPLATWSVSCVLCSLRVQTEVPKGSTVLSNKTFELAEKLQKMLDGE